VEQVSTATSRHATVLLWAPVLAALLLLLGWARALWAGYLFAALAVFLMSEDARGITGQALNVCGGFSM